MTPLSATDILSDTADCIDEQINRFTCCALDVVILRIPDTTHLDHERFSAWYRMASSLLDGGFGNLTSYMFEEDCTYGEAQQARLMHLAMLATLLEDDPDILPELFAPFVP